LLQGERTTHTDEPVANNAKGQSKCQRHSAPDCAETQGVSGARK
jgi:hypothetical protein